MALSDRQKAAFKGLVNGQGQPDDRDVAKALLDLDAALAAAEAKISRSEAAAAPSVTDQAP